MTMATRKALNIVFALALMAAPFCPVQVQAQALAQRDTLKELLRRIDILTEEIESLKLGAVAKKELQYESKFGMGPAASRVYQIERTGVSIAAYGEVVYENHSTERDDGSASGSPDQLDYLRHITYIGFRFNDWLLFNSEIEFEHGIAGGDEPGEVAVEFGYVEAAINSVLNVRAGMILVPVGIINEFHEPPTFHGSLRPETERSIIPTTWRANGVGLVGNSANGLGYKLYVTESLNASKFSSGGIRSGRQNGAEAIAEDIGLSGRLDYNGIPGLNIGGSFFIGNTGQNMADSIEAGVRLFSLHVMFARRGLELRGLFAQSSIDEADKLNAALNLNGADSIGESQRGYYLTLAYDLMPLLIPGTTHALAPFVQFEHLNTQAEVPSGFAKNPALERTNISLGLTYKPHPNIAFKADYLNRDNKADTAVDQFNLAVNYLF